MNEHYLVLASLGFATLIMAWLPSISKKVKISFPIILILLGFLLYAIGAPLAWPDPLWSDINLMYFSELIVIIALMGAGLKIGSVFSFSTWKRPLLLVFITMPICIAAAYFMGIYFLAFSIPSSLLLAAILAPTDPVLAAEVQLEEPTREKEPEDKRKFTLTTEAGLNDGMAYPFTYLAVMVAQAGGWATLNFSNWVWDKLLLKVVIGIIIGIVIGRLIGYLLDRLHVVTGIKTFDGFVSLSLTFMTYGLTEILHGYGFLAVFFVGLTLRYYERISGDYKTKMHDFIHEIERLLLTVWVILFGGSILNGILTLTDWKGILFAFIFVLIIRPLAGLIGLIGVKDPIKTKLAISFLGIRGIGSVFYISWAFVQYDNFENKNELYAITFYVILISIVIHGLTAPRIIAYFDKLGNKE
ncbi:cation:proton antiporter [Gillisia sp. JM1]|uniref:cation:proton antiporter n=1 Tax=Gillisia sp. JM1 TaxID=1283286 RepID=UPI00040339CE|nr:cation:proton antiporter [Gillisia sp. JM1]